ncbi:hypothetical protein ABG067_006006 [Albugo candida]|uniref:Anaphase-promoting complex subunit 4 WD40 domain-containing protein n=1 Tax=Albugo candida TaxID=65357 RepID=A0A024GAK5_9STRA|nr:unnamed protein product [Albugo candida]|eukprot:CCI43704.1 unnamed protein product [Albugo candida]
MIASSSAFVYTPKTSIWCMEIDPIYDQYLLVGTSKSRLLLYDVAKFSSDSPEMPCNPSSYSQSLHNTSKNQSAVALQQSASTCPTLTSTLPSGVSSLSWYPDGGICVVSVFDEEGSVQIWDGNELAIVKTWKLGSKVFTVKFSACATTHSLAAASTGNGQIRLCDVATGASTHTLLGHKDSVWTLAWSPVNEYELATACSRGEIRFWDIRRSGMTACLYCTSQDGEAVVPSRAAVWEAQSSSLQTAEPRRTKMTKMSISSLSRQYRDIQRAKSTINVHLPRKQDKKKQRIDHQRRDPHLSASYSHVRAHNGGINSLCFTPNGRFLLSTGTDQTIRLWNTSNGSHAFVHYQDAKNGVMGRSVRMQCIQEADERSTVLFHPNGKLGELVSYLVHPNEEADTHLYRQAKSEKKLGVPLTCGSAPIIKSTAHFAAITSCVYRKSTCELYTAGEDGLIMRWKPKNDANWVTEEDSEGSEDKWSDLEEEEEERAMRFVPPILN